MSGSVVLRMSRTVDGSLNGRECRTYQAGEVYELPDQGPGGLADVFLREGWAERVVAENEPALDLTPADDVSAASLTPRRCQATTKAGAQCQRDAELGSDYCSLPPHQAQADA